MRSLNAFCNTYACICHLAGNSTNICSGLHCIKMDESALNAAMDAAMKRSDSQKGKITKQEAESFKKAFAKPEFRDLFNDYLKEVYLIFMAFNSFSFPFQINMEFEMFSCH